MIPFIRSLTELIVISKSRENYKKSDQVEDYNCLIEESGQRKRYVKSLNEKRGNLPNINIKTRDQLLKKKKNLSKFLSRKSYYSQIQSTYDLTLLERQNNYNHKDVA